MRFIRFLAPALTALLFGAAILRAQDFSKYRDFSLGTNLATVLKRSEKKLADVTTTHGAPALFQEVTWWPPSLPGAQWLRAAYGHPHGHRWRYCRRILERVAGFDGYGGTIITSLVAMVSAVVLTALAAYVNGTRIYACQP
jgi:hypothetical protein